MGSTGPVPTIVRTVRRWGGDRFPGCRCGTATLAEQAAKSIAAESLGSDTLKRRWFDSRAWHSLASPAFVAEVEKEMQTMEAEGAGAFASGSAGRSEEDG